MISDPSWLDRTSAWWAKADRAKDHLGSLGRQVEEFHASKPYTVTPEPTDTPGHTAYRLRLHKPVPVAISTTVGDILHNLRSAVDSLADEIAGRGRAAHAGGVAVPRFLPVSCTPSARPGPCLP